jgi:hypothetical protein
MATATILQLPQAIGLTGAEQLEGVQSGSSVRVTAAQVAALAEYIVPTGPTGVIDAVPASGANNNYNPGADFSASTGFVDLTPTANCNITGLLAGFDGQIVIITNLSAFVLTLNALNSGSLSANQFRMVGDFALAQNNGQSFKYSATIGKWVAL